MGFLKEEEISQCFELMVGIGCVLCFPLCMNQVRIKIHSQICFGTDCSSW